ACATRRADLIRALDGTHPVLRQSPPILSFSISVTFAFTAAAMYAATRPAEPAPITTRLRSNFAGFGHFASRRRLLTDPTTYLATSGKMPISTREPISAGERIPEIDLRVASW